MRYFKLPLTAKMDFTYGIPIEQHIMETERYCSFVYCEPQEGWQEMTAEDFRQKIDRGADLEPEPEEAAQTQPTNAEIYENQLILMEALADLYAGGGYHG